MRRNFAQILQSGKVDYKKEYFMEIEQAGRKPKFDAIKTEIEKK